MRSLRQICSPHLQINRPQFIVERAAEQRVVDQRDASGGDAFDPTTIMLKL